VRFRVAATACLLIGVVVGCGAHRDGNERSGLPFSISLVNQVFAAHGLPLVKNGGSDKMTTRHHGPRDPIAFLDRSSDLVESLQFVTVYPAPLEWPKNLSCHGPSLQPRCEDENVAVGNVQLVFVPRAAYVWRVMAVINDLRRRLGLPPV
jgi:hypothetical protein